MRKAKPRENGVAEFLFPFYAWCAVRRASLGRLILIFCLCLVCSCDSVGVSRPKKRAEVPSGSDADIVIGIVETSLFKNFFSEGVSLAVEEINARGGVLGRRLRAMVRDDRGDTELAERIAGEFAENEEVVAVVGHMKSDSAISVSPTYEKAGILFMAYGAKDPALTRYAGPLTFRNIPTNEEFGRQMADVIIPANKFGRMVMFFERDSGYKSLSETFRTRAAALGTEFPATRSYFGEDRDFRGVISEVKKNYEFDAIFIAGAVPAAAHIVKQLREMDVREPIIGGAGLDSPMLRSIAGGDAEGTIVATVFNPMHREGGTQEFVRKFEASFGFLPDTWAAQGYDAVSVLAFAMEKSDSTSPVVLASALQFVENWEGATGTYSFSSDGDIRDKELFFKVMHNGKFVFMKEGKESLGDVTLKIPLPESVGTLDPGLAATDAEIEIAEQLFLGLTDIDPLTYEALPELAQSWESEENGKIWRFRLREDIRWTGGDPRPVTAHDVVWAVQRNISPETQAPEALRLGHIENANAAMSGMLDDPSDLCVRALDDFTVEFTLGEGTAFFPIIVSHPIWHPLPRDAITEHGDSWTDPELIRTNGPYVPGPREEVMRRMVLRKNPDYHDADKVFIQEIHYYILPEREVAMAMYEENRLHILGGTYTAIPDRRIGDLGVHPVLGREYSTFPGLCMVSLCFDPRMPPADDPLVRKAISAAIDRQLIAWVVTRGKDGAAGGLTPPALAISPEEENRGIRFSPMMAKEWLARAGYPDGKGFPGIVLRHSGSGDMAQAIRKCVKRYLNIDIRVVSASGPESEASSAEERGVHLFECDRCADYPDADSFLNETFRTPNPGMEFWKENREFMQLISASRSQTDPEMRRRMHARAETILWEEEALVIPVCFRRHHYLVKPQIRNWHPVSFGGQHILRWYFGER